jgi:hypothetical protein
MLIQISLIFGGICFLVSSIGFLWLVVSERRDNKVRSEKIKALGNIHHQAWKSAQDVVDDLHRQARNCRQDLPWKNGTQNA